MADLLTHCERYVLGYVEARTEGSRHGRLHQLPTRGELRHLSLVLSGFFTERQVYDALAELIRMGKVFKRGPYIKISEMEILR